MRLNSIKLSGLQVLRRSDPLPAARPTRRRRRAQRLRQVQHHGCGALGAGRKQGERAARRVDAGRHLQRLGLAQAGRRAPASSWSFDNSHGRAGGPWNQFAEIAVKRVLTRDGTCSYYINNQPVRRRDVQDVFLGTGLGPRAYAIIGQGTISRIIESKPEELRLFLEEAAGVSKYKERRRETENRLKDTRDNLLRVEDILRELNANLEKLERQAEVATRYRDAAGDRAAQAAPAVVPEASRCVARGRARQPGGGRRPPTRSSRAWPNCATSRHSSKRCAWRTTRRPTPARLAGRACAGAARGEPARGTHPLRGRRPPARRGAGWPSCRCRTRGGWSARARPRAEHARLAGEIEAAERAERARGRAGRRAMGIGRALEAACAWRRRRAAPARRGHAVAAADPGAGRREPQHRGAARAGRARRERLAARARPRHARPGELEAAQRSGRRGRGGDGRDRGGAEVQRACPSSTSNAARSRSVVNRTSRAPGRPRRAWRRCGRLQEKVQTEGKLKPWLAKHGLDGLAGLWTRVHIESGWETALESALRERLNALSVGRLDIVRAFVADAPPAKLAFFAAAGRDRRTRTHAAAAVRPAAAERRRPAGPAQRLARRRVHRRRLDDALARAASSRTARSS